jgi:hypothetical protein
MLVLNALCIFRGPSAMFYGFRFFDNVRGQIVLMLDIFYVYIKSKCYILWVLVF